MWWEASTPDNFRAVPWMHPAAVMYLESLLAASMTVIEHGSGGSTMWLAARVEYVDSYEHDAAWIDVLRKRAQDNVIIHGPDARPPIGMTCDLLLVDGERSARPEWLDAGKDGLVKSGGIIILDNSNRPEYEKARDILRCYSAHYVTIAPAPVASMKHPQYSHTEFYRMPGGNIDWI